MQANYPNQNYDVVRLDEYNSNGEFQRKFSQAGILYLLNKEVGIYIFIASDYNSVNSFGYLICLDRAAAESLVSGNSATSMVHKIVDDIN